MVVSIDYHEIMYNKLVILVQGLYISCRFVGQFWIWPFYLGHEFLKLNGWFIVSKSLSLSFSPAIHFATLF